MRSVKIMYRGEEIGEARIEVKGLYYVISCICTELGREHYRIMATADAGTVDLGVCLHSKGNMMLNRSVPIKALGTGDITFDICARKERLENILQNLATGMELPTFPNLEKARLVTKDGQTGLVEDN